MLELTIPRPTLAAALTIAARVASTTTAIDAGKGVLLTVDGATATVAATDFDTSIVLPLDGVTDTTKGQIVLPAKLLHDVVKHAAGDTVTIAQTDKAEARITAGASDFKLRGYRLEDFPELPAANGEQAELPVAPFIHAVDQVAGASSKDESRPVLTGIHVRAGGAHLRAEATDSYRLSVSTQPLEGSAAAQFDANVPAKALNELAKLAKSTGTDTIMLTVAGRQLVFTLDRTVLSTRLIDGSYPDVDALIPDSTEHAVTVDATELAATVARIALLCNHLDPVVLTFAKDGLTVSARARDIGEASERLEDVQWDSAEPLQVGFNPGYLRHALETFGDSSVQLGIVSPLRPMLISDTNDQLQQILMPIRLNIPAAA